MIELDKELGNNANFTPERECSPRVEDSILQHSNKNLKPMFSNPVELSKDMNDSIKRETLIGDTVGLSKELTPEPVKKFTIKPSINF